MTFSINTRQGVIHHDLHDVKMTAGRFISFLENACQYLTPQDHNELIFDNAPTHRRAGDVRLLRNCSVALYSPFLNIIENYFSQYEAKIKHDLAKTRDSTLNCPHEERIDHSR